MLRGSCACYFSGGSILHLMDGSFLVIDSLIAMQVTSHFLSDTGLLLLRCVQLLFFAVTLTLEGTTGQYPPTA